MSGYDLPLRERGRVSSGLIGVLLIGIGIVMGVVVASEMGWMPFGHAVPEAPVARQTQSSPPTGASLGAGIINGQMFVQVAKAVKPAVVNVFSTRTGRGELP